MNKQNPTAFWFRNHFSCKIFTFRAELFIFQGMLQTLPSVTPL